MRVQFRRHQRWDWEDHVAQIDGGGLGRRIAILEAGVQGRGGVYRRTHKKSPGFRSLSAHRAAHRAGLKR